MSWMRHTSQAMILRDIRRAAWSALALSLLALGFALLAWTQSAGAQTRSRTFPDGNGRFSGSAQQHGNSSSYFDTHGQFGGSAIRNSDGSTSYYDGRGRFQGSERR
jgi:hypothetical protein